MNECSRQKVLTSTEIHMCVCVLGQWLSVCVSAALWERQEIPQRTEGIHFFLPTSLSLPLFFNLGKAGEAKSSLLNLLCHYRKDSHCLLH